MLTIIAPSRALRRICLLATLIALPQSVTAQPPANAQAQLQLRARRDSLERELQRIAIVDRKVMVTMRD